MFLNEKFKVLKRTMTSVKPISMEKVNEDFIYHRFITYRQQARENVARIFQEIIAKFLGDKFALSRRRLPIKFKVEIIAVRSSGLSFGKENEVTKVNI